MKVEDLVALPLDSPPCSPSVRAAADKAISEVVEAVAESSKVCVFIVLLFVCMCDHECE